MKALNKRYKLQWDFFFNIKRICEHNFKQLEFNFEQWMLKTPKSLNWFSKALF